jgi:hypothetical protein
LGLYGYNKRSNHGPCPINKNTGELGREIRVKSCEIKTKITSDFATIKYWEGNPEDGDRRYIKTYRVYEQKDVNEQVPEYVYIDVPTGGYHTEKKFINCNARSYIPGGDLITSSYQIEIPVSVPTNNKQIYATGNSINIDDSIIRISPKPEDRCACNICHCSYGRMQNSKFKRSTVSKIPDKKLVIETPSESDNIVPKKVVSNTQKSECCIII